MTQNRTMKRRWYIKKMIRKNTKVKDTKEKDKTEERKWHERKWHKKKTAKRKWHGCPQILELREVPQGRHQRPADTQGDTRDSGYITTTIKKCTPCSSRHKPTTERALNLWTAEFVRQGYPVEVSNLADSCWTPIWNCHQLAQCYASSLQLPTLTVISTRITTNR